MKTNIQNQTQKTLLSVSALILTAGVAHGADPQPPMQPPQQGNFNNGLNGGLNGVPNPNPEMMRVPLELEQQTNQDLRQDLNQIHNLEQQQREQTAWQLQRNSQSQTQSQTQSKNASLPENQSAQSQTQSEYAMCLDYSGVQLNGVTFFDDKELRAKLPKCVNDQTINQLNRDIVGAYLEKGYPQTKIDFETTPEKVLNVNVKEARISKMKGRSHRVNVDMLFPDYKGKPLNVHYLDQGIEQANKVVGNRVSMDIYPNEDGTVDVELKNQPTKPISGSLSVDNTGSDPIKGVVRGNVAIGSPLGLSDTLYIGGYTNLRQGTNHYSRGGNVFYSVPLGRWTFSAYATGSRSQSITHFAIQNVDFAYRSKSNAVGLKAERVMSRGQKHITTVGLGLDYLSTTATFGGNTLKIQSPKIRSGQFDLSHTQILSNGVLIGSVGVERGIAKDVSNTPFDKRYTNYSLSGTLVQNRALGKKRLWSIRNQHRLVGQYGRNQVYSTKEFDIIGRSAVRGFRSLSLNSNRGAYINNTVSFRRQLPNRFYIEPSLGVDLGAVKDDVGWQKAVGVSAGLTFAKAGSWQANVDVAKGFARTTASNRSNIQTQVNASLRWSF